MEAYNETPPLPRKRHGCVTTWLILMIIINAVTALVYLFASDLIKPYMQADVSKTMFTALVIVCFANIVFSILLLLWKKIGFWGFIVTSVIAFVINLSIGLGVLQSLFGLVGVVILYAILQIEESNVSAWEHLE